MSAMRQLQLFTTTELAKMRDPTASRNYCPHRAEFRRAHERHRAWGLTRRHAERLRRTRATAHALTAAGMSSPHEARNSARTGLPNPTSPRQARLSGDAATTPDYDRQPHPNAVAAPDHDRQPHPNPDVIAAPDHDHDHDHDREPNLSPDAVAALGRIRQERLTGSTIAVLGRDAAEWRTEFGAQVGAADNTHRALRQPGVLRIVSAPAERKRSGSPVSIHPPPRRPEPQHHSVAYPASGIAGTSARRRHVSAETARQRGDGARDPPSPARGPVPPLSANPAATAGTGSPIASLGHEPDDQPDGGTRGRLPRPAKSESVWLETPC